MDMGYDLGPVYDGFEARGSHPVIPLRETPAVKAGKHRPPLRAWRVDVRRLGRHAAGGHVALPHG